MMLKMFMTLIIVMYPDDGQPWWLTTMMTTMTIKTIADWWRRSGRPHSEHDCRDIRRQNHHWNLHILCIATSYNYYIAPHCINVVRRQNHHWVLPKHALHCYILQLLHCTATIMLTGGKTICTGCIALISQLNLNVAVNKYNMLYLQYLPYHQITFHY